MKKLSVFSVFVFAIVGFGGYFSSIAHAQTATTLSPAAQAAAEQQIQVMKAEVIKLQMEEGIVPPAEPTNAVPNTVAPSTVVPSTGGGEVLGASTISPVELSEINQALTSLTAVLVSINNQLAANPTAATRNWTPTITELKTIGTTLGLIVTSMTGGSNIAQATPVAPSTPAAGTSPVAVTQPTTAPAATTPAAGTPAATAPAAITPTAPAATTPITPTQTASTSSFWSSLNWPLVIVVVLILAAIAAWLWWPEEEQRSKTQQQNQQPKKPTPVVVQSSSAPVIVTMPKSNVTVQSTQSSQTPMSTAVGAPSSRPQNQGQNQNPVKRPA